MDVGQKTSDWRHPISIHAEYASYLHKLITILERFASLWDIHSGRISTVVRRIDLELSDILPIHSVPYCAGTKARVFEKPEIDHILAMNVIE